MSIENLYLVRHARSALHGKYCGSIDAPLNAYGKRQANGLRRVFSKKRIDICFVSDLKRTTQTLDAILKNRDCFILKSPNIREIRFGEWEGKNYKTVSRLYKNDYNLWMKKPYLIQFPGGESFSEFYKRVEQFYKFLVEIKSKNVLIVAHGGTIAALKLILLDLPKSQFWSLAPRNAEIFHLKKTRGKKWFQWVN